MPETEARLLDTPRAAVGESPVWDAALRRLWWVDIRAPALYRTDPETGATESWVLPEPVGSLCLCTGGGLLLALKSGVYRYDPVSRARALLAAPEADRPWNRLNDGKASPEGRFLFGSMDDRPEKAPTGALWSLAPDGGCVRLADGLFVSNGLAWSPDGRTLWHSDSRAGVIWTAPYDPASGVIGERRVVARPDGATGRPDGAATDTAGGYWSAGVSAGVLNRWLADGSLERQVALPVRAPTMPCFAGPGLRTLFVTSLRGEGAGPADGGVVRLGLGCAGVPVGRFAG
jgi:sugar lactone lactonase YvrE